jgi:hypothetical protein
MQRRIRVETSHGRIEVLRCGFPVRQARKSAARLHSAVVNRISEHEGATPVAVQMECRQTICRVQLTGLDDSDRSKAMAAITGPGEFREIIAMDRPIGGNATTSDVYLVMK